MHFVFSFSPLSSHQDVEIPIPEFYIPKGRAPCFSEDTAPPLDVLTFVECHRGMSLNIEVPK